MEDAVSLGQLIEGLDFSQFPPPGEDVVGAIVLLKVRARDGTVGVRSLWSDDLDWLERVGMHTVAAQSELPGADDEDTWLDEELVPSALHAVDTGPEALGDTRPGSRRDAAAADRHEG